MQRQRQQMRVSEDNIGRVQGIGLDEIGRELVIGNFPNIPIYETTRAEALERGWERGSKIQEVGRTRREKEGLQYAERTLLAAIAALIVGVIGVVISLLY
jgi:preprotein translocase subunit Sss1